jgi:Family of unknown function (DUF6225)
MKCAEHGADGCVDCKHVCEAAWTVGQLKAALTAIPDDTPLIANIATDDPGCVDEQVIIAAGFGSVNWGDGKSWQRDSRFGLTCEWPAELATPQRPSLGDGSGALPAPEGRALAYARTADAEHNRTRAKPDPSAMANAAAFRSGFLVEATAVDGRGYALLTCRRCSQYNYLVSNRVGGRIGDLIRTQDLSALLIAATMHQCPPEVRSWTGQ